MKKTAYCIHHTHWDPLWYFTKEDAIVQFAYNMKELLAGFEQERIRNFFLDGQTKALEDYLAAHPADREKIECLIRLEKLFIGPFNSQLDCFISSGEAVINNLRLGMNFAEKLGGVSRIAYLPDSFGHSADFPKIFTRMGIHDFVVTRGVGDEYGLKNEFYMESDDGSRLLVATMLAGYGYGTYAFKDGTLFTDRAEDYNKRDVHGLIDRLLETTTLEDSFVFPLGFDQNPAILDIEKKIKAYNKEQSEIRFTQTTWKDYLEKVREEGQGLKTHRGELFSTQHHRVHRSIFSARADIKRIQDETERCLTFAVQPLMSMLDHLGLPYDQGLIDKAWRMLIECQTHASATVTDTVNAFLLERSKSALHMSEALKIYLLKHLALSRKKEENRTPFVLINPLPYARKEAMRLTLYTAHKDFRITHDNLEIPYALIDTEPMSKSVRRNPPKDHPADAFYAHTIAIMPPPFAGMGYKTLTVHDGEKGQREKVAKRTSTIENDRYRLIHDNDGLHLHDKKLNRHTKNIFMLEESGDAGDNYDYDHPTHDWLLHDNLGTADVTSALQSDPYASITVRGTMAVPKDLERRKGKIKDSAIGYAITLTLKKGTGIIETEGHIDNHAKNHRVRLLIKSGAKNDHSVAGTQFSFIRRETEPAHLENWREHGFFEEPSPTYPLLNTVCGGSDHATCVFTKSIKEYEFTGDGKSLIALTLFRSVGHLGLPDLNRRPGRPSGLDNRIIETPDSQMKGRNPFRFALMTAEKFEPNLVMRTYTAYAGDILHYQNQDHHNTVHKLSYFPVNPAGSHYPDHFDFLTLKESTAVFSTLIKDEKTSMYQLRIFNTDDDAITVNLQSSHLKPCCKSNLRGIGENRITPSFTLRKKELSTILLKP